MIRFVNDETKLMLVLSLRSWYMSVVSKADRSALFYQDWFYKEMCSNSGEHEQINVNNSINQEVKRHRVVLYSYSPAPTPTFPKRIGVVSQQSPPRTQNADVSSTALMSFLLISPRTAALSNGIRRFRVVLLLLLIVL